MDSTMKDQRRPRRRYSAALTFACATCARADTGIPQRRWSFSISRAISLRRPSLTPWADLLTPRCQPPARRSREKSIALQNEVCQRYLGTITRGGASKQSDQSDQKIDDDMSKSNPSTLLTPAAPPRQSTPTCTSASASSDATTYFVSSHKTKGTRPYMEDEFIVSNGGKFCAVFDGHGGSAVSRYLRQNLYASLQAALPAAAAAEAIETRNDESSDQDEQTDDDAVASDKVKKPAMSTAPSVTACINALQTAFEKVNAEVNRISHWSYQGSTAVAVMIHEGTVDEDGLLQRTLISANVGDSRAILCKRDGTVVQLTRDHKPNDIMERNRIEAIGGSVDWCGMRDTDGKPIEGTGVYRINGNLAVARAIGDRAEKPCVSSEVEISTYNISGDRMGDIVLLASDGLWDVMENEDVADFVRQKLQEVVVDAPGAIDEGESVALEAKQLRKQWKRVAELVVDEALKRGSTDNVSVVIIMIG